MPVGRPSPMVRSGAGLAVPVVVTVFSLLDDEFCTLSEVDPCVTELAGMGDELVESELELKEDGIGVPTVTVMVLVAYEPETLAVEDAEIESGELTSAKDDALLTAVCNVKEDFRVSDINKSLVVEDFSESVTKLLTLS